MLGGAPRQSETDTLAEVTDETTCRDAAAVVHRDLLGWKEGVPPVVVIRVRDYLIAFPSNAVRGEWGLAVGMTPAMEIRGVAAW